MKTKTYSWREIKTYVRKHTKSYYKHYLYKPSRMFGGLSARQLYEKSEDYSTDIMGSFRRMFE